MSKATQFDLIRHGEPVGGRCYRGHGVDDPLSDLGWVQMRRAVEGVTEWDAVISSPMLRCRVFAEELAHRLKVPLHTEQAFKEIGFGIWEGHKPKDVERDWPEAYRNFYADPVNLRPEGAEPVAEFRDRVVNAYERLTQEFQGQHCLIVAHAGVIRALITYVLEGSLHSLFRIKVPYASVTRLRVGVNGSELLFHDGVLRGRN